MATSGNNLVKDLKKNLEKNQWSMKTVTAIVLFSAIILVFVFFGYTTGNDATGQGAAARVNDAYISLVDLGNETQRLEQFYSSLFGGQMPGGAQRQFVQNQALENLISSELMAQSAAAENILASDFEIASFITTEVDAFKEEGRFRRDRYEAVLTANQWTPGVFEARIRKDRQVQRLRRLFEVGVEPLQIEKGKLDKLSETKINLNFVRLDREQLKMSNSISEAQAQQKLAQAEFKKRVADEFQIRKGDLDKPEEVKAAHILIKGTEAASLQKITELKKRAEKEDFAALAKAHSEDEGSKSSGGDLGFFGRGRMVPEFEEVAFKQAPGQISDPVKSQFGYHIIKVIEKRAPTPATLEAHELSIAKSLIALDEFDAKLKILEEALAKSDNAVAEQTLKELKSSWEETGWFDLGTASIPKIGVPAALEALPEILQKKGLHSKVFREGPVVFVAKYKEMKVEPAAEDKKAGASLAASAQARANDLMGQWIEEAKKTAVVEKNQRVLNQ